MATQQQRAAADARRAQPLKLSRSPFNSIALVICAAVVVLAFSSEARASQDKIIVEATQKSASSNKETTTTSRPAASTQSVAAEAAAEAAAAALGNIQSGLEQALSIVPASINLESSSSSTTAAPASSKIVVVESSSSSKTTTTSTTTPAPSSTTPASGEKLVVTVHTIDESANASSSHKHSGKQISANDALHKFDLFMDPVCEQLAKLTDKQLSRLGAQLKQVNVLVSFRFSLMNEKIYLSLSSSALHFSPLFYVC